MRDRLRRRWRQLSEDPAPPAEPLRSPRAPPDAQMQPASCHAPQFPPNVAPVAQAALVYGPPVFFETGHVRAAPSPRTPARVCATPTAAHHQLHPKPRCGRRRAAHYVARVDLSASPRDRLQNRSNRCGQDRAPLGHLATGAALGLLHGRPRSVSAWCVLGKRPAKRPCTPHRHCACRGALPLAPSTDAADLRRALCHAASAGRPSHGRRLDLAGGRQFRGELCAAPHRRRGALCLRRPVPNTQASRP